MADTGFNKIQLKQLQGLFDKNNNQTNDSIVHIVDSLSETIENVKSELCEKIDSEVKTLKEELRKIVNGSSVVFRTT